MPLINEYFAYIDRSSRIEFLQVAKEVYWNKLKVDILLNKFYSIIVGESINRIMEHHLIIYITYLTNEGRGQCVTKFICFLHIKDKTTLCIYDAMRTLLA